MPNTGFNRLELAIFDSIKRVYSNQLISDQIDAAVLESRDYTGAGYFVYFSVPKHIPRIDIEKFEGQSHLTGPLIKTASLKEDAWCHVFVTAGYLDCLEMYTFGPETFPEKMNAFEILDIAPCKPKSGVMVLLSNLFRLLMPQRQKNFPRKYSGE